MAARSCVAGRSSRACAGALSSPGCWVARLLHGGERPAVAGELARDGDGHDRASLAAGLERVPAAVKPACALVGPRPDRGWLPLPPALERVARAQRSAL